MALIQLSGGSVAQPVGALNVRLSHGSGVELLLLNAAGASVEPSFRKTPTEVVVLPDEALTVVARCTSGGSFPPDTRIGVSLRSMSNPADEVVRPPLDAGGRASVALVEIVGGTIVDLAHDSSDSDRAWQQRGHRAFHINHPGSRQPGRAWVAVVDGSASGAARNPERYHAFLELVLAVATAAYRRQADRVLVAGQPTMEMTQAMEADEVDWAGCLPERPAPWPMLGDAVRSALASLPEDASVVLIVEGVMVDYREVAELLAGREHIVVAIGKSRFGARAVDRPQEFWEEELAALEVFDRVASVADLLLDAEGEVALADAMFPRSEA
ncbi:hypothetical protein [Tessaracoccus sp. OH4464_COT-324]|uniref:hypothetical protein n=1 Tax=Tessaracoccus sp. OH4464_COT-324 TaxID=2491059 RepID=UPI000F63A493|nr:hypothetical protein [Tessaracoccus sp. OH4464_COT-324]RRD46037.1 hypothetical protein EII42_08785 [Tessaracoccus sp. OH4464_COT-324]